MSKNRLAITGMSAADFYRRRFPAFMAFEPSDLVFDGSCAYKDEEVWSLAPFWADKSFTEPEGGVLHVLTRSAADRGNARTIRPHVWSGDLPEGAFFECNADVVVASPEFTFLQLATKLSLAQLVAYGDELCGYYSFTPDDPRGYRVRKVPLTSTAKLSAFLQKVKGKRGYRQAISALPHIVDGFTCPSCTTAELLLCMSYHRGGYSVPTPHVNHEVQLNKRGSLLVGQQSLHVGLFWPDANVCFDVMEPGDEEAAQPDSQQYRSAALSFSGCKPHQATDSQLQDLYQFEDQAVLIAKALGKRVPGKKRGAFPARVLLRESLFAWNDSLGHVRKDA